MTRTELWPFQTEAVESLRESIRMGNHKPILCSPTGSGKTEIAMEIIRSAHAKGKSAIFVCDRKVLVNQTSDRFSLNDIPHGIAMADDTRDRMEPIQICSAQTLERRGFLRAGRPAADELFGGLSTSEKPDLIVIDECHDIRTNLLRMAHSAGCPVIGLTATPFREGLAKHYNGIVNVTTTNQLIRDGYLAPLKVVASDNVVNTRDIRKTKTGEWVKDDLSPEVQKISGRIVPEWARQTRKYFGGPVPTIAFVPRISDAENLAQQFQMAGHDFRTVHSKMNDTEKMEAIRDFRAGKHTGLVSCVSLTKGFDVPATLCMIDAYPLRKSLSMHIQKMGRIMRRAEGKEFGLVIDHTGNYLGFYEAMHAFFASGVDSLLDASRAGKTVRKEEDLFEKTEPVCPECKMPLPPRVRECQLCGYERPRPEGTLLETEDKLVEIDALTGEGEFKGDWWLEICRHASEMPFLRGDYDRARRYAQAKHHSLRGHFARKRFEWKKDPPHPFVKNLIDKQYREWKKQQS